METQFIPSELAEKLKELGFNEPCLAHYYLMDGAFELTQLDEQKPKFLLAPLWQQSFDWFREKHNKHAIIYKIEISEGVYNWDWDIVAGNDEDEMEFDLPLCETYYEARLACLEKLIELTTQQK